MKTEKPWGYEDLMYVGKYAMKRLHIDAGKRTSLHVHAQKHETMYVARGRAVMIIGDRTEIVEEGSWRRIEPGTQHRIAATKTQSVDVIEASTPQLDDVLRVHDDYERDGK